MENNVNVWLNDYAPNAGIEQSVIDYIRDNPNHFKTEQELNRLGVSPRKWNQVSEVIKFYGRNKRVREYLVIELLGYDLAEKFLESIDKGLDYVI